MSEQSVHDTYQNPLISRYASTEMSQIWSAQKKHSTWRRLWVALADSERELGIEISQAQIDTLAAHVDDIDFDRAASFERELRHDVMAHVSTFKEQCPTAGGILHLGATSCFVTDNTELIQIRESLQLVKQRLVDVIRALATFSKTHRSLPCMGMTHLQPAQPTTVGKRATLWCYDLLLDLEEITHRLETLRFRGVKGTTGTQASFLELFKGDHAKIDALDRAVTQKMGFSERYPVTGQTYSRKVDAHVLEALGGVAQSSHKAATDIRILQGLRELEEPFETKQIGSSAMAYKRNPMRSERICALARFALSLVANGQQTAATQWMERTLDDSANRRLSLPQAFLAIDSILIIYRNIAEGLVVYPAVIARRLAEELPFMATEDIMMAGVQAGGDRQELHEAIRVHSIEASKRMKEDGAANDLLSRMQGDPAFAKVTIDEQLLVASRYIGRAPEQVDAFLAECVEPILARETGTTAAAELRV